MANYYDTTIKSDKMTQEIASEIFNKLVEKYRIRYFDYDETQLKFNTRGLPNIQDVLSKYNINRDEIEVKDEFELIYETLELLNGSNL